MADDSLDEWTKHLTAEFREHFDRVGEDLVRTDVSRHAYASAEKHMAALAWLHEKRTARDSRETTRYRWMLLVTAVAAIGAVLAVLAAKGWI